MSQKFSLRHKLMLTTALVATSVTGYGRRAYAACTLTSGTTYLCTGANTTQQDILNIDNAEVLTAPGFSVNTTSGNAMNIEGDEALSFTDDNASVLIADTGFGLSVKAGTTNPAPASATVRTNGTITGTTGIYLYNKDFGDITITVDGDVTGTKLATSGTLAYAGIVALLKPTSVQSGADITITTGPDSRISGNYGIVTLNQSQGNTFITVDGEVTGSGGSGIFAHNQLGSGLILSDGMDTEITTGAASKISGKYGIDAINTGSSSSDGSMAFFHGGSITITANGEVTGTAGYGIRANNFDGSDILITTGPDSLITGETGGISVRNVSPFGTTVKVVANGDVIGKTQNGILAAGLSADLLVSTAAGKTVQGGLNGIITDNGGIGSTTITANGTVIGSGGDGISAHNSETAKNLTVITGSNSIVNGNGIGITATNLGTGSTSVTANGEVTGGGNQGILVENGSTATDINMTTGAGSKISGGTGIAIFSGGTGATRIIANGDITGTSNAGIGVYGNDSTTNISITTGPDSTVTGIASGISTTNYGYGETIILADGTVNGTAGTGIAANNMGGNTTNLTIRTLAGSTVNGYEYGLVARNNGTGALTINAAGTVSGARNNGILADNLGSDLTVAAVSGSTVYGGNFGILSNNAGTGDLKITADGNVTGLRQSGIRARNSADSADLVVVTAADSVIKGGMQGINIGNAGHGTTSITVEGDVTGSTRDGILANNSASTTDLLVTAGSGSSIRGQENGINTTNLGTGTTRITNSGYVRGATRNGIQVETTIGTGLDIATTAGSVTRGYVDGINARGNGGALGLNITADGDITGEINDGIDATDTGNGVLSIALNGKVSGGGGTGLAARNTATGTGVTITASADSVVSGRYAGIYLRSNGSGTVRITAAGDINASAGDGIDAVGGPGEEMIVTAGAGSEITAASYGIDALKLGGGSLTITAAGVINAGQYGIGGFNHGTDLTIATGVGSAITADGGIFADNNGSGSAAITANGSIAALAQHGIVGTNEGADLKISTGAQSDTKGHLIGIYGYNRGVGALTVTANGKVAGDTEDGIRARNVGTDLVVTTGAESTVKGGLRGIYAINQGSGTLSIVAEGDVSGQTQGIGAFNSAAGGGLTIATTGIVKGQDYGIRARNEGRNALAITMGGDVSGVAKAGIEAVNTGASALKITLGDGTIGGANGIHAVNTGTELTILAGVGSRVKGSEDGIVAESAGSGAMTISIDGEVSGEKGYGIVADNSAAVDSSIAVGDRGLVRGALAAIKASSLDGQTFNIVNKGEIQNNSGLSSDLAIIASGGAAAIDNRSLDTITGTIVLGAGDDAFTNSGTWRTAGGENLFGDGSDQVVNAIGGRIIAAQSATVAEATQFTALEGFSNRGTLSLNDGGAGDVTRVAGSFAGEGGTVRLDTELGGSSSKTDLLAIAGNTSGDTSLFVLNAGGSGALTTGDGIKVIEIAGISSGSFELGAPVIAGAYAYKLHRGGNGSAGGNPVDGDWYLRSFVENPDPDPEPPLPLYQPGVPIYETYPRLLQALNGTSSLWQRTGARYWSASGTQLEQGDGPGSATADEAGGAAKAIWTRIDGAHGRDRPDVSTAATRHDSDQWLLQSGLDGLLAETQAGGRLFGGVTVHYGQASADVRSRFGDGSIDSTGYGAGLTMTWLQQNGFYVDGQAQLTWFESDLGSSQLGSLVNDNDATGYALSLEAGRRIEVGGNWTITPQAQLVYSKVDFDTFTGPSSERVSLLDGDSLQGRIGVAVDHAANWYDDAGKPRQSRIYGIANLYREFLDGTAVNVSHVEIANKSDRVWGEIGLGGSYQWNGAYALYGEVTASTAFADFGDSYKLNGSVALRVSW